MKFAIQFAFLAITIANLASCSCGIFRNTYVADIEQAQLSNRLVTRVAAANGFSRKSPKDGQTCFVRKDVELLYEEIGQVLILRSSYCPFIPFRVDSEPWVSRCKEYAGMIEKSFRAAGVPIRELSTDESIDRNSKREKVGDGTRQ